MDETPMPAEKTESGVGATIGIVILILLFVAGGIYFFITQEQKFRQAPSTEQALGE